MTSEESTDQLEQHLRTQFTAAAAVAAQELSQKLSVKEIQALVGPPVTDGSMPLSATATMQDGLTAKISSWISRPAVHGIPRPNGEMYFPRQLQGRRDVDILQRYRHLRVGVLLNGYPGCGKTAMVEAAFGDELITVAGHGDMEAGDFVGGYQQDENGQYFWQDGPLLKAMREGKVLFVDDITLIPPAVIARTYPLLDGRGQILVSEGPTPTTPVKSAPGFGIFAAYNPGAPGSALAEALSSRFLLRPKVTTDMSTAKHLGVSRKLLAVARELYQLRDEQQLTSWAPEMREMLGFMLNERELGEQTAAANLLGLCPEEDRELVAPVISKAYGVTGVLAI